MHSFFRYDDTEGCQLKWWFPSAIQVILTS